MDALALPSEIINGIDLADWGGLVSQLAELMSQRKTRGRTAPEDLLGVGWIGLKYAAGNFDHTRGLKFRTYAASCIRGYMQTHLDETRPHSRKEIRAVRRGKKEALNRIGPIPIGDDGVEMEFADWRGDGGEAGYAAVLDQVLDGLTEREQMIARERFVNGTIREKIGDGLGISRQRIAQIEAEIVSKLEERVIASDRIGETWKPAAVEAAPPVDTELIGELCGCGCKRPVRALDNGEVRKYIHGHRPGRVEKPPVGSLEELRARYSSARSPRVDEFIDFVPFICESGGVRPGWSASDDPFRLTELGRSLFSRLGGSKERAAARLLLTGPTGIESIAKQVGLSRTDTRRVRGALMTMVVWPETGAWRDQPEVDVEGMTVEDRAQRQKNANIAAAAERRVVAEPRRCALAAMVTEAQGALVKEAAAAAGQSVSDWVAARIMVGDQLAPPASAGGGFAALRGELDRIAKLEALLERGKRLLEAWRVEAEVLDGR